MRNRHLMRVILAALLLVIAPATTAAQTGSGQHYRDPSGVEFDYPAGWTVTPTDGFIVVSDPAGTSFIVIYAFTEDKDYTAQQCITDTVGAFQNTLPNLIVTATQSLTTGPDDVSATLSYNAPDGGGFAGMVCRLDHGQGLLYLGATPYSLYDQHWPLITAIADSITYTPEDSAFTAPDVHITYVTWTDPLENAFTVDVPKEWNIEGGMVDIDGTKLPVIQATALDESIWITIGISEVLWFLAPTPALTDAGYPTGSTFFEQDGVTIMVAEYLSGGEAAQFLTEFSFEPWCEHFETTATRDLGDGYAADGSYLNTGETAFTCTSSGETIDGYYHLTTRATYHATLGQVWTIDNILGYLAQEEQTVLAGAILARMVGSFALTPEWIAAQPPPETAPVTGTWDIDPDADLDQASLDILLEVNQMMNDTSLIIIDNIDGYSDYEYEYDYDYGW